MLLPDVAINSGKADSGQKRSDASHRPVPPGYWRRHALPEGDSSNTGSPVRWRARANREFREDDACGRRGGGERCVVFRMKPW